MVDHGWISHWNSRKKNIYNTNSGKQTTETSNRRVPSRQDKVNQTIQPHNNDRQPEQIHKNKIKIYSSAILILCLHDHHPFFAITYDEVYIYIYYKNTRNATQVYKRSNNNIINDTTRKPTTPVTVSQIKEWDMYRLRYWSCWYDEKKTHVHFTKDSLCKSRLAVFSMRLSGRKSWSDCSLNQHPC